MIDDFTVFARSGLILWRKSFVKLRGDPLARLVQTVLLEDRVALKELAHDGYTVRWLLENEAGLVFALVYQTSLPPAYADDLLSSVRSDFVSRYREKLKDDAEDDFAEYSNQFERLLTVAEDKSLSRVAAARNANTATASIPGRTATPLSAQASRRSDVDGMDGDAESMITESRGDGTEAVEDDPEEVVRRNREAFLRRRGGLGGARRKSSSNGPPASAGAAAEAPSSGKRPKQPRKSSKVTAGEIAALDFSEKPDGDDANQLTEEARDAVELARFREQFVDAKPNDAYDVIAADPDNLDDEGETAAIQNSRGGGVFSYFKGLAGMKTLTKGDLESVLEKFREALIAKNVAQEIADKLMESVGASLEGKRLETMTTVTTTVRNALDGALTRILTPRQSVDILSEIEARKGGGRPYVITYCGVNGVGKSTSLAKTCFYLLNNGCRVLIAACDTFRAGAVEQLRTHVRCLGDNVELFDRGYGKDAAAVAMDAIRRAKELRYDVVLVDTAGRMQDNEPLMRALSKLVEVNQPDRLFFVGEALVGNDAVDQLKKFNSALADHQKSANPRLIDGIVLTKFDTIDDKVGAAVSMVYTTGQPIVFVGVGQTYMDLRKVNTKSLVRALLR